MSINPEKYIGLEDNKTFHCELGFPTETVFTNHSETDTDFYNPSVMQSVKPSKFLAHFKFNGESKNVTPHFNPKEKHFCYPVEPMVKLIPFQRLAKIKYDTVLAERLRNNVDDCRRELGFNGFTPTQQTINRFFYKYMGPDGHQELLDRLVVRLKEVMDKKGIPFGVRVGVDSTPLETLPKDETGVYNLHYLETYDIGKMVKVQFLVCVDTGIPITSIVTDGNSYDGHYLMSLLNKAKSLGFDIKEVYGDNHYGSYENWAKVSVLFGAKCFFNLCEDDTLRPDGTERKIRQQYQRFWKEEGFVPDADFNYVCKFLMEHGVYESVGAYYRNQWWKIRQKDLVEYKVLKSPRNNNETLHGILKEQLDFNKHLSRKGWNNIDIYVKQYVITMVIVALIRAENGVKGGFVKVSEGVFS